MNEGLARLHLIDVAAAGLSDYGKPGRLFSSRQYQRWTDPRSSETARLEDMERLIAWLADEFPGHGRVALVHGDWRIDNMIFERVLRRACSAVLDWELSTLGRPFADLAYMACNGGSSGTAFHHRPGGEQPSDRPDTVAAYCDKMAFESIPVNLLVALSSSAASRSTRASTSAGSTATRRIRSSPAIGRVGAARWPISPGNIERPRARPCSPACSPRVAVL